MASAVGVPVPDRVELVAEPGLCLLQRGGFLGVGSRWVLVVGASGLAVLSIAEFRALLASEFVRARVGTRALVWLRARRTAAEAANLRSATEEDCRLRLTCLPSVLLRRLFLALTHRMFDDHAASADRTVVDIFGAAHLRNALLCACAAPSVFRRFHDLDLIPAIDAGYCPPLVRGFQLFLRDTAIGGKLLHHLFQHPTGSGRVVGELALRRLALLESVLPNNSPRTPSTGAATAWSLFEAAPDVEIRLTELVACTRGSASLIPVDWEALGGRALLPQWEAVVRLHASSLKQLTLASIPDWLYQGAITDAEHAGWKGMPPPAGIATIPEFVIGAAVAACLVRLGGELTYTPGVQVSIRYSGLFFCPFSVVRELAVGETTAADWRARCAQAEIGDVCLADPGNLGELDSSGV